MWFYIFLVQTNPGKNCCLFWIAYQLNCLPKALKSRSHLKEEGALLAEICRVLNMHSTKHLQKPCLFLCNPDGFLRFVVQITTSKSTLELIFLHKTFWMNSKNKFMKIKSIFTCKITSQTKKTTEYKSRKQVWCF